MFEVLVFLFLFLVDVGEADVGGKPTVSLPSHGRAPKGFAGSMSVPMQRWQTWRGTSAASRVVGEPTSMRKP